MPMYKTILEAIAGQPGSYTTQIASTASTYTKAAEYLRDTMDVSPNAKVLDYGAGLGLGTRAVRQIFPNTDGHETDPQNASVAPKYTDSSQIQSNTYDAVICLNVLNVLPNLPPENAAQVDQDIREILKNLGATTDFLKELKPTPVMLRDQVVRDIMRVLKPSGGIAIIGTRGWSGDVSTNKFILTDPTDKRAGWIVRKTPKGLTPVYQKGFDNNELARYIESQWRGNVRGDPMPLKNLTKAAVLVVKS